MSNQPRHFRTHIGDVSLLKPTLSQFPTRSRSKGFPYWFTNLPEFRVRFTKRINLRFALLLPSDYPYRDSIRKALKVAKCRHVTSENRRCAAFALGASRSEDQKEEWYIFTLQSDLAFSRHAALRDFLRGWRHRLFEAIIRSARENNVSGLYLPSADEVYRSARFARPRLSAQPPKSWEVIYDKTATDFNMKMVNISLPVNIQVMPHLRSHLCSRFYKLALGRTPLSSHGELLKGDP